MSYIAEQVSYLKGLAEGMKIDETKNEGKLLLKIIDVLDEVADCLGEMTDSQNEMQLQIDAVDSDLEDLEDFVYEEYEDEDDDWEDEWFECPNCGEDICLTEDLLSDDADSFICPHCGEKIDIEFDDDEDYDD